MASIGVLGNQQAGEEDESEEGEQLPCPSVSLLLTD
jgi:hypothetical protein